VSFQVAAALYDCPNNCSGRGTCNAVSMECTCSEVGRAGGGEGEAEAGEGGREGRRERAPAAGSGA
jgi:hypothetical protein